MNYVEQKLSYNQIRDKRPSHLNINSMFMTYEIKLFQKWAGF